MFHVELAFIIIPVIRFTMQKKFTAGGVNFGEGRSSPQMNIRGMSHAMSVDNVNVDVRGAGEGNGSTNALRMLELGNVT